jgi:hypothetical protein
MTQPTKKAVRGQRHIDLAAYKDAPDDQLVDEYVASAFLDVDIATTRRWRWLRSGVPFIKVNGWACRYRLGDIREHIRANRHVPVEAA